MQKISGKEAKSLVETFIEEHVTESEYDVITNNAINYLSSGRFDLAAKLLYLDDLKNCRSVNNDIYKEHIRLLTLGKYTEPGNKDKNSLEKYEQVFKAMYSDFREKGFDSSVSLLPITYDGSIANGGHRVACAINLGLKVNAIKLNAVHPQILNYQFFRDRGASVDFLDRCSTAFVKHCPKTYIAIIWPAAIGKREEIENILGKIVYFKELFLSLHGLHNLVSEIYQDEVWLGNRKDNFPGAAGKTMPCFLKNQPVRIYAFQSESYEEVLIKKQQIRDLFKIDKHSIHINDNHKQAIYISNFVFNINAEHFLNYGYPNKYNEAVDKFESFLQFCKVNDINIENIVLDGGIVLSLYGLRKCNDIDYLYDGIITKKKITENNRGQNDSNINSHAEEIQHHGESIAGLVHNSNNYFCYRGVKILSIKQIIKMKEARGEAKDLIDLSLMKRIDNQKTIGFLIMKARNQAFFIKAKLFYLVVNILVYLRLYKIIRFFYRKLKGIKT